MSLDGDRLAIRNPNASFNAADIRQTPSSNASNTHALYVQNTATTGLGQALVIESANPSVPAFTVTAPTGGTAQRWNGALVVSAVAGAPDPATLPLGGTSKAANTGIQLVGSFAGSEDDSSGTDSTPRINIYSYQRAATNSFGEIMRNWLMRKDSKAMVAWYGPQLTGTQSHGYDANRNALTSGVSWKPWAWIGAHYEANDHLSTHGHWSMEVPDTTGALQTRFEILFADRTTGLIGLDKTFILTNQADLVVRCSQGVLRMAASAGTEKAIEFNLDSFGDSTLRRWKIRTNNTAESGSNVGSDFQIVRYNDSGVSQDSPIEITRSTGQVILGPTGGVLIQRGSGVALAVNPTATGGQALLVTGTDATARAYQGQVTGDANIRYVRYVDGKTEWGDGTLGRDTNLYRTAAATLKTDHSLVVSNRITVGTGSLQTSKVYSTSDGTVEAGKFLSSADGTASLAVVVINPSTTAKRVLDMRLAADGVSRLKVDFSAGSGSGTLGFGDGTTNDTNLYRGAADLLKTDDKFVTVAGLGVGNSAAATALGSVVKKMQVFDASGVSLGYVPIYDAIT